MPERCVVTPSILCCLGKCDYAIFCSGRQDYVLKCIFVASTVAKRLVPSLPTVLSDETWCRKEAPNRCKDERYRFLGRCNGKDQSSCRHGHENALPLAVSSGNNVVQTITGIRHNSCNHFHSLLSRFFTGNVDLLQRGLLLVALRFGFLLDPCLFTIRLGIGSF